MVSYTYYQLGAPASDSFTYQVSDGQGGSATGQVQMTFTTGGESSVTGTIYAESIFGNSADNVIVGSGGADQIDGRGGFDQVWYINSTVGVTVNLATGVNLYGDAAGDVLLNIEGVSGSGYNDTLTGNAADNVLYGNNGNDYLSGGAGNDLLSGGSGADRLVGDSGNDIIYGDVGADLIGGGEGDDTVYGGTEADLLRGDNGNDTLYGDDGDDSLFGGGTGTTDGNDRLYGGNGNDNLTGNAGADYLDGGVGNDTSSYASSTAGVTVALSDDLLFGLPGSGLGGEAQGDVLINIENLTGSAYDDSLSGSNLANTINGLAGNDRIFGYGGDDNLSGGDGNDTIYAGTGNDILTGGSGSDYLNGEAGTDTVSYSNSAGAIGLTINGSGWMGDATGDQLLNIETVTGSAYNDIIYNGSNQSMTLNGGAGNDTLTAGNAGGQLSGNEGNDTLNGGAGVDVILGGTGNDRLAGAAGNDILTGGAGADIFAFSNHTYAGNDRITDFSAAEDRLNVSPFMGELGLGWSTLNPVAAGVAHFVQSGTAALLQFDFDGAGSAPFVTVATIDNQSAEALNANSLIWA